MPVSIVLIDPIAPTITAACNSCFAGQGKLVEVNSLTSRHLSSFTSHTAWSYHGLLCIADDVRSRHCNCSSVSLMCKTRLGASSDKKVEYTEQSSNSTGGVHTECSECSDRAQDKDRNHEQYVPCLVELCGELVEGHPIHQHFVKISDRLVSKRFLLLCQFRAFFLVLCRPDHVDTRELRHLQSSTQQVKKRSARGWMSCRDSAPV